MTKLTKATSVAKKKLCLKKETPAKRPHGCAKRGPRGGLARIPFNKAAARRQFDVGYYQAQVSNWKNMGFIEAEKKRLGTPKWGQVTRILKHFRDLGLERRSKTAKILVKIFEKNKDIALGRAPFTKTEKVLSVVARVETLLLAYKRVKRNRGALTRAAHLSAQVYSRLGPRQRTLYTSTRLAPDGIHLRDFDLASFLIMKNAYPWGTSRRIWLEKPGSNKKRPITIPPFMDRIVQEAIKMVLHAIWEPDFEKMNRSFGFRPNKSCGDAITAILSPAGSGLHMGIEGEIQGAYDAVPRRKMVAQLGEKIRDKSFLDFMKKRLNYDYVDETGRQRPPIGIPQGGVDSPYLFNIHLSALDRFIHDPENGIQAYFNKLNARIRLKTEPGYRYKPARNLSEKRNRIMQRLTALRIQLLEDSSLPRELSDRIRSERFKLMSEVKHISQQILRMPTYDPASRRLRFLYVRYADDWVLFTNADPQITQRLKAMIRDFLAEELGATLSDEKTTITDIRHKPAHFLGFELKRQMRGRRMSVHRPGIKTRMLVNTADVGIHAAPDRQRLIERMHAKGFCEADGFPKDVPWIANMDAITIIERYNASIRGVLLYYVPHVMRSSLMRWVYILRFSCLKTLARKYALSISKVYRRFGIYLNIPKRKTIRVKLTVSVSGQMYERSFELLTFETAYRQVKALGMAQRFRETFWSRERGVIGEYTLNPTRPAITQDSFLDYFSWVSWRSIAPFYMPCLICGRSDDVEMHHIRHIRKRPYASLPDMAFLRIMNLRNRKQIPVCRRCHREVIHAGDYRGPRLNRLTHQTHVLFDNRVAHSEAFINPSRIEHFGKSLEEKGFRRQQNRTQTPGKSSHKLDKNSYGKK
jgi:retron-type reverse transcriptase